MQPGKQVVPPLPTQSGEIHLSHEDLWQSNHLCNKSHYLTPVCVCVWAVSHNLQRNAAEGRTSQRPNLRSAGVWTGNHWERKQRTITSISNRWHSCSAVICDVELGTALCNSCTCQHVSTGQKGNDGQKPHLRVIHHPKIIKFAKYNAKCVFFSSGLDLDMLLKGFQTDILKCHGITITVPW